MDGGSLSCGAFQIKDALLQDCGAPGGGELLNPQKYFISHIWVFMQACCQDLGRQNVFHVP